MEPGDKEGDTDDDMDSTMRGPKHSDDSFRLPEDFKLPTDFIDLKKSASSEPPEFRQIGPYRLTEMIAEGGMGEVYIAEQSEPVHRLVAFKIVKPGLDSREVLRRFEAERQALAMLDHPCITHVFDAGTAPSGRPYFVMELVDGMPITRYCDHRKLSPAKRLQLFVKVCDAIHHAHQRGIIHRDLKPSNILVEEIDGVATPKIIDFGIAKAIGTELTERTMETQLGDLLGTPQYMSPEQALGKLREVDTRTDIYSLGVILYELLTGSAPISKEEIYEAGILGVGKLLMELEPERPSTRLITMGEDATTIAASRGTDPTRLCKSLRRELDWVTLKCLEKERDRRYESASDLARDLERHLNNQVVEARPPDLAYRIRKYTSRHKIEMIAVGSVMLTLILGIIASMLFAFEAWEQREEAKQAQAQERLGREAMTALQHAGTAPAESLRKLYHLNDRGMPGGIVAEWNALTDNAELSNPIQSALAQTVELARERMRYDFPGAWTPGQSAIDPEGKMIAIPMSYRRDSESAPKIQIINLQTGDFTVLNTPFPNTCKSIAFLSDGKTVAAGFDHGVVGLITMDSGKIETFDTHPGSSVSRFAAARGKKLLISFGGDGFCRRWTENGKPFGVPAKIGKGVFEQIATSSEGDIAVLRPSPIAPTQELVIVEWLEDQPPEVKNVPLTSSAASVVYIDEPGQNIITGHVNGAIEFRDRSGDFLSAPLPAHRAPVNSVSLLPGGKYLASGVRGSGAKVVERGNLRIWNLETGRPSSPPLIGHNGSITGIGLALGNKYLVSVGTDRTCRLWDLLGQQAAAPIHTEIVAEAMAFLPNGNQLLSVHSDSSLQIRDWQSGETIATGRLSIPGKPVTLHVSASGEYGAVHIANAKSFELFRIPDLQPLPPVPIEKGIILTLAFHPDKERLYWVASNGDLKFADEETGWTPNLIGKIPTSGNTHTIACQMQWLEQEQALLIAGTIGPPVLIGEDGVIHDRLAFDAQNGIQIMHGWSNAEGSWCATLGFNASQVHMVPIQNGKFEATISREIFPIRIQGEEMARSPVSGYLGIGSVNGLFAVTDEKLNVIVPPFYPHDSRLEAVTSHPDLPLFATSGRDKKIRFWAAGPDAYLQLVENRQSKRIDSANTVIAKREPASSGKSSGRGVAFEAAGVTIPAHPDWEQIRSAMVVGAFESLLKSVGDEYRRVEPRRAWFRKGTNGTGGLSNRDFVVYTEATEGANPESFARRIGFYAGIAINDWSTALSPAVTFERSSARLDWDEAAGIMTFSGLLSLGEGHKAEMKAHWVVADGSMVGAVAFGLLGNAESEQFLQQVEHMVYSAIIRDSNQLSKQRRLEMSETLRHQWKRIQRASGFKDGYDAANSIWMNNRNTEKGLELATSAMDFATRQEQNNRGLWQEVEWKRKRIRATAMVGHSTAVCVDKEKGIALIDSALEEIQREADRAKTPVNYDALANTLGLKRNLLGDLKMSDLERLELQKRAIEANKQALKLSTNRKFVYQLAAAYHSAASLARNAKIPDEALQYSKEAERIIVEDYHPGTPPIQQRWRELSIYQDLQASIYNDAKEYTKAIAAMLKSIDSAKKTKEIRPDNSSYQSTHSSRIWRAANLYRNENTWKANEPAIRYGLQSIAILEELKAAGKLSEQAEKELDSRKANVAKWQQEIQESNQ